ncbi:hypothetical protein C4F40_01225 [Sphingobacterium sp. Ka21]|uniref:Uncharacterized protein n=1 Tax=Sphingobacterium pedocola TaxID=2082722 RepID=A0ABR9T246_9SPHI|nr:hypothetical protein [Sphingobacterium pedocola]
MIIYNGSSLSHAGKYDASTDTYDAKGGGAPTISVQVCPKMTFIGHMIMIIIQTMTSIINRGHLPVLFIISKKLELDIKV